MVDVEIILAHFCTFGIQIGVVLVSLRSLLSSKSRRWTPRDDGLNKNQKNLVRGSSPGHVLC